MEGFVYQWINKINGKWYIGSHKGTPDDGYRAGGILINRAFKKYGIENFKRHILWCNNYREMEEYYLCKLDAANDPMSYNMKNAAIGGKTSTSFKKGHKPVGAGAKKGVPQNWNKKKCTVKGLNFNSINEAADHFSVNRRTIRLWLLR